MRYVLDYRGFRQKKNSKIVGHVVNQFITCISGLQLLFLPKNCNIFQGHFWWQKFHLQKIDQVMMQAPTWGSQPGKGKQHWVGFNVEEKLMFVTDSYLAGTETFQLPLKPSSVLRSLDVVRRDLKFFKVMKCCMCCMHMTTKNGIFA